MFDGIDGTRLLGLALLAVCWGSLAHVSGRPGAASLWTAARHDRLNRRYRRGVRLGWALLAALVGVIAAQFALYGHWIVFAQLAFELPALLMAAGFTWLNRASTRRHAGNLVMATTALLALDAGLYPPVPTDLMTYWLAWIMALVLVVGWNALRTRLTANRATTAPPLRQALNRTLAWSPRLVLLLAAGVWVVWAQQSSYLPGQMHINVPAPDGAVAATAEGNARTATSQPHAAPISTAQLTGDCSGGPVRSFTLTAQATTLTLSSGARVAAWTYNGQAPGPTLRVQQGDVVKVTLRDQLPGTNVTLHWHGVNVPNGEDGVPGVTQNAVTPGGQFTYCFRADQAGTYWYHSHQLSNVEVQKGLFGALIVTPAAHAESSATPAYDGSASTSAVATRDASAAQKPSTPAGLDLPVLIHAWPGLDGESHLAFGTDDTLKHRAAAAGTPVRLRLINSSNDPVTLTLTGTPFKVAAIDGADLHEPTDLTDARLVLAAGGRYDLTFTMPGEPVRLSALGHPDLGLTLSPDGTGDIQPVTDVPLFDPLHYGTPAPTPFGLDSHFDRRYTVFLDNKLGFYKGRLNFIYTINGRSFPRTPTFMVREGDLVELTFVNRSSMPHPMHLHGHHLLVLSRDGRSPQGSPIWVDTLDIPAGETWVVAFKADNPGIWMFHCHNLEHAAMGMMARVAYVGVTTPFVMGANTVNQPE